MWKFLLKEVRLVEAKRTLNDANKISLYEVWKQALLNEGDYCAMTRMGADDLQITWYHLDLSEK